MFFCCYCFGFFFVYLFWKNETESLLAAMMAWSSQFTYADFRLGAVLLPSFPGAAITDLCPAPSFLHMFYFEDHIL